MKYFGAWRPILRNLFIYMRKQMGLSKAEMVRRVIKDQIDKIDIFIDLFGIIPETMDSIQQEETRKQLTIDILHGREPRP
mmetsp:Transcript_37080/g.56901  ORF Transcript_37080/g.56901 Transcript_37080/m.56901 type:complete len:80 (+) Transcript_37080:2113-2352(+)